MQRLSTLCIALCCTPVIAIFLAGNVRELKSVIERAWVFCQNGVLQMKTFADGTATYWILKW